MTRAMFHMADESPKMFPLPARNGAGGIDERRFDSRIFSLDSSLPVGGRGVVRAPVP